jgi:hypothetical protein
MNRLAVRASPCRPPGQTLETAVTGERLTCVHTAASTGRELLATCVHTAASTGGELLAFDVALRPGAPARAQLRHRVVSAAARLRAQPPRTRTLTCRVTTRDQGSRFARGTTNRKR